MDAHSWKRGALLLLICAGGCADLGDELGPGGNTVLWARSGELFEVRAYNPSVDGGYRWEITKDFSEAVAVSKEYRTEPAGGTMIGGPTTEIWTYRAKSAGTSTLEMTLSRPWESHPGIDRKEFVLTVY